MKLEFLFPSPLRGIIAVALVAVIVAVVIVGSKRWHAYAEQNLAKAQAANGQTFLSDMPAKTTAKTREFFEKTLEAYHNPRIAPEWRKAAVGVLRYHSEQAGVRATCAAVASAAWADLVRVSPQSDTMEVRSPKSVRHGYYVVPYLVAVTPPEAVKTPGLADDRMVSFCWMTEAEAERQPFAEKSAP
jgi:cytoskeletal protein RodZ